VILTVPARRYRFVGVVDEPMPSLDSAAASGRLHLQMGMPRIIGRDEDLSTIRELFDAQRLKRALELIIAATSSSQTEAATDEAHIAARAAHA
jgi:hypothetical protein